MKFIPLLLSVVITLGFSGFASAHGLNMSTAQVTLRQNNHISIRVHTSLKEILAQLNWKGKPKSFTELATSTEDKLKPMGLALRALFTDKMPITVGDTKMESKKARLPNARQLQSKLQKVLAQKVMQKRQGKQQNDHHSSNDLIIEIDGFVPKGADSSQLNIHFPKELGAIMVSYNKPQVQTLKAGKSATRYQQAL